VNPVPSRLLLGVLFAAVGCGSGGTTSNNNNGNSGYPPTQPSGNPVAVASVNVDDDFYAPNAVLLAVGGTVTWNWVGINGHSVTSDGSPSFSPNKGVSPVNTTLGPVVFATAGTYNYYCTVHGVGGYGSTGEMKGTIFVR